MTGTYRIQSHTISRCGILIAAVALLALPLAPNAVAQPSDLQRRASLEKWWVALVACPPVRCASGVSASSG
jgi:hypothetical protein